MVECHGWYRGSVLRWIIGTDQGRIAGAYVLRERPRARDREDFKAWWTERLPTSVRLLESPAARRAMAEARWQTTPRDTTWEEQRRVQAEAHVIAESLAQGQPIAPSLLAKIANVEARSEAIERTVGWAGVAEHLPLRARSPRGELRYGGVMGINILLVRCPSTGKTYGLRAPPKYRTVAGALRFVNHVELKRIPRPAVCAPPRARVAPFLLHLREPDRPALPRTTGE